MSWSLGVFWGWKWLEDGEKELKLLGFEARVWFCLLYLLSLPVENKDGYVFQKPNTSLIKNHFGEYFTHLLWLFSIAINISSVIIDPMIHVLGRDV